MPITVAAENQPLLYPPPLVSGWSQNEWHISIPEVQGMSSTRLHQFHDYIRQQEFLLDSVLVVRHGYIVYEDYPSIYRADDIHILHSVTKSFTSALIGIAISQGYINSVQDTVVSFFPNRTIANLNAWKQAMTVEHLLNMLAGIEWDEWTYPYTDPRNDLVQMVYSGDCVQFMLDRPMAAAPGTDWVYNTGASHLLGAIIYQTTGLTPLDYAYEVLFGPLGITDVYWSPDSQGLNYGGSELHLRPRDMAKLGLLYLHNGAWQGQQIIPSEWVSQSQEIVAYPDVGTGYGYQWWKTPSQGTFEARGYQNQWIIVHPEGDLVVVLTASDIDHRIPIFYLFSEYIIGAIREHSLLSMLLSMPSLVIVLAIGLPITVFLSYLLVKKYKSKMPSQSA